MKQTGQLTRKMEEALEYWDYDRLLRTKEERAIWLKSEASYIKGMIYRCSKVPVTDDTKTLQIGAGPTDVIDHWKQGERYAIDPLADEYKQLFSEFMDKDVQYVKGLGEELPFEDDSFDVVIVRNAFDHMKNPSKALTEMHRVLKPTGATYIWIYLYSWRASIAYRTINAFTKRYETEPWAFTYKRIMRLLRNEAFIPALPAIEERPRLFKKPENISAYFKQSIKKLLDFGHGYAFSCVALPDKGFHKEWKLVGT